MGRLRYTFILILVALGTCLAAVSGWRYARASAPVNGPIILVSIDALRADHLPAYGYRGVETPAIDSLAADGVVFDRAYAHAPQTLPSHASLLTGRLPFETGVRDGVGFVLPSTERLLPEMLRDRGYATGGVVSSFLLRKETGISQGFTFFDGDMPPSDLATGGTHRDGSESERIAERWLDSVGTSRAFLFLHVDEPRRPYAPPPESGYEATYDGEIAYADEILGHLLHYLKAHQLYDQSTVILVSDHGEGLGDHGEQAHGLFVYDETLHVPLIIKQPAAEGAKRRVGALVQLIDLVPTILDLAKAPVAANLRGRSLTTLLDHDNRSLPDAAVYAESLFGLYHFGWGALSTLTDGKYRYIKAPREELYDLERDPGEHENLAVERPELVAAFREKLKGFGAGPAPALTAATTEEHRGRYEALGYVGTPAEPSPPWSEYPDPKDRWIVLEQYRSAVELDASRDWEASIERFRALALREPGMRDVWMLLAKTASRRDRWDVTVEAYKHAIQLAPSPDAFLGAAAALFRLKELDNAAQQAQRVLDDTAARASDKSAAHELLARIALGRRHTDIARTEAALAEEADVSRPVSAYVNGRISFDQRRYEEALESFETAQTLVEKTGGAPPADLRLSTAETLQHLERFSEAESLFLEELEDSPLSGRARAGLTAVYAATGRHAEAAAIAHH